MRHFLAPTDLDNDERGEVLARALSFKQMRRPLGSTSLRVGGLYFNPSLRTRVSWEQAAQFIGGTAQTLNAGQDLWKMEMDPQAVMDQDSVENVVEAAGVLGRFFDILGIRSFPQGRGWDIEKEEPVLKAFAEHSGTQIVSLEGAMHHPCQSLADHLTLWEKFGTNLSGLRVALMWAWHPKHLPMAVPNSFAVQASLAGADLVIAHPPGYDLDPAIMAQCPEDCVTHSLDEALDLADVIYVKSWGSLSSTQPPDPSLRAWICDEPAMEKASVDATVMHCLPTRRNVEIASAVLDSPQSAVIDEAENRMWAQAGLLSFLSEVG